MSLIYTNGFDFGIEVPPRVDAWSSPNGWLSNDGRRATSGAFQAYNGGYFRKTFDVYMSEFIIGFAINPSTASPTQSFVRLYSGGSGGTLQLEFLFNGANKNLQCKRGDGTVLFTDTTTNTGGQWVHFELRCLIDNTNGALIIKRNEVEIQNLTGIDTSNVAGSPTQVNYLELRNFVGSTNQTRYDDLYVIHIDGSGVNDFIGDCRIDRLMPSANSSVSWTPSAGSNYQCVDELPFNETDYVSTQTPNAVDLYDFDDLPYSPTSIYGMTTVVHAAEDVAGLRRISPVLQISGGSPETDHYGDEHTLGVTWTQSDQVWEVNPETGVAWVAAEINSLVAGVKVTT